MALNIALIVIGLIICFGGIYFRRICSAVMGFVWGTLVSFAVAVLLVGLFGLDDDVFLIILLFGLACSVLSAIYYRLCAAISAFLSVFWIVVVVMLVVGEETELRMLFLLAGMIALLFGYLAYKVYEFAYMLMTAFSGAFIANVGWYGASHGLDPDELAYSLLQGSSDMYLTIIFGTLVLGIAGFFVQRARSRNKRVPDANRGQVRRHILTEPKQRGAVSKFSTRTGIEKDGLLYIIPIAAFLGIPYLNVLPWGDMAGGHQMHEAIYWLQQISEMLALAALVYTTLLKTVRFNLIYGLIWSVSYVILNMAYLPYAGIWELTVNVLRIIILWGALHIAAKAVSNDGLKPVILLAVGLVLFFFALDWLCYLNVWFYMSAAVMIEAVISFVCLFFIFRIKLGVNIFVPGSAFEYTSLNGESKAVSSNAAGMILGVKGVDGSAAPSPKTDTGSAVETLLESPYYQSNQAAFDGIRYRGDQPKYKIDWLLESLDLGHEIESNGYYIFRSIKEGLPYFCETEYEYKQFHDPDAPVLQGSIKGMMNIAFFYHPVSKEHGHPSKMMYWKDKLISLAESGNLEAQAALTKNLHVFSERETDRLKTLYLGRIRRLAAEGDPEAQLAYGEFICDHRSKEAIKWLKMAAQQGLSDAWFNLAKRYGAFQVLDDNGEIRKEPLPKAEELELERRVVKSYLHGAEADNGIMAARCQYMIASYYEDGNAVLPKDLEQAKYWYKKAADHGDESAARSYQSIVEHPEWFRRS